MAIGVGSIVAVKVSSAQLALGNASAGSPCKGVSESASTPFTVTWQNTGARVAAIPDTSLDEIKDPGAPALALIGQVVNLTDGASPALNSLVVEAYARGVNDVVLMQSIATGAFMEVLASAVTVQAGE
jgi:hypothetical protein